MKTNTIDLIKIEKTVHPIHKNWSRFWIMIPTTEYDLSNLLGVLKRSSHLNNGDWYHEWIITIQEVMQKLGIQELTNNFGDKITLKSLKNGDWLKQ